MVLRQLQQSQMLINNQKASHLLPSFADGSNNVRMQTTAGVDAANSITMEIAQSTDESQDSDVKRVRHITVRSPNTLVTLGPMSGTSDD